MRSKKAFPLLSQWLFAFTLTTSDKIKSGKKSFSFHFTGLKKNSKLTAEMKLKENFIRFLKVVPKENYKWVEIDSERISFFRAIMFSQETFKSFDT